LNKYLITINTQNWLESPELIKNIPKDELIYTPIASEQYLRNLKLNGWENTSQYEFLRNIPSPNTNLLYNKSNFEVYTSRFLWRTSEFNNQLTQFIFSNQEDLKNKDAIKLFQLSSIKNIISEKKLLNEQLSLNQQLSTKDKQLNLYSYKVKNSLPMAYIATDIIQSEGLNEDINKILNPLFIVGKTVILEEEINWKKKFHIRYKNS
jgi:hypothetical protein